MTEFQFGERQCEFIEKEKSQAGRINKKKRQTAAAVQCAQVPAALYAFASSPLFFSFCVFCTRPSLIINVVIATNQVSQPAFPRDCVSTLLRLPVLHPSNPLVIAPFNVFSTPYLVCFRNVSRTAAQRSDVHPLPLAFFLLRHLSILTAFPRFSPDPPTTVG